MMSLLCPLGSTSQNSVNIHRQVHIHVYDTQHVERSCCIKRSNGSASAAYINVGNGWCAGFFCLLGSAIYPGAVRDDVQYLYVIDQRHFSPFRDVDAVWEKIGGVHVDRSARASTAATAATSTGWSRISRIAGFFARARAGNKQDAAYRKQGEEYTKKA